MANPNALAARDDDAALKRKLRTDELRGGSFDRPTKAQIAAYKKAQTNLKRMATATSAVREPVVEQSNEITEARADETIRGLGGEVLYLIDSEGDIVVDDRSEFPVDDLGYTVPFIDPEELAAEHDYLPKAS